MSPCLRLRMMQNIACGSGRCDKCQLDSIRKLSRAWWCAGFGRGSMSARPSDVGGWCTHKQRTHIHRGCTHARRALRTCRCTEAAAARSPAMSGAALSSRSPSRARTIASDISPARRSLATRQRACSGRKLAEGSGFPRVSQPFARPDPTDDGAPTPNPGETHHPDRPVAPAVSSIFCIFSFPTYEQASASLPRGDVAFSAIKAIGLWGVARPRLAGAGADAEESIAEKGGCSGPARQTNCTNDDAACRRDLTEFEGRGNHRHAPCH
ncbi:hypothetical protein OBBRIDRAFT_24375 [Obba rivulosa]|uniref:Uncharacterized protein n=1 Tax=Obba rivulosa TaxID=1052685 RepID=A0A8E2DSP7_9APHY|nr:hypothetical protein OBBRIDRAFT_24375 [Obba rivulosa]